MLNFLIVINGLLIYLNIDQAYVWAGLIPQLLKTDYLRDAPKSYQLEINKYMWIWYVIYYNQNILFCPFCLTNWFLLFFLLLSSYSRYWILAIKSIPKLAICFDFNLELCYKRHLTLENSWFQKKAIFYCISSMLCQEVTSLDKLICTAWRIRRQRMHSACTVHTIS